MEEEYSKKVRRIKERERERGGVRREGRRGVKQKERSEREE